MLYDYLGTDCFFSLLDNSHYTFNIIHFSVFPQDGSSPEVPSLERKNKRRKIKGKKGIVQNILAERNCSFSNSAFLQPHTECSLWLSNTDCPFINIFLPFVVLLNGLEKFDFSTVYVIAAIEEIHDAT